MITQSNFLFTYNRNLTLETIVCHIQQASHTNIGLIPTSKVRSWDIKKIDLEVKYN